MTNEEKARQLIGENCKSENCLECGGRLSAENGGCVQFHRIIKMAEWKDEQFALVEQSPAWSEEDEDYYNAIIAKLEVTQDDALLTDNQMNFLKSLKNRVQPYWKPTQAQITALKIVKNGFPADDLDAIESLINDLKKL